MIDHLVYAHPHVDEYVDIFESQCGIRPRFGGSHPGGGTKNYILPLVSPDEGPCYLEFIGPDENQPDADPEESMFGLLKDGLDFAPRLLTFAIHPQDIDHVAAAGRAAGYDFAHPTSASRFTARGQILRWRYAVAEPLPFDGLQPFLIDWGATPHPGQLTEEVPPEERLYLLQLDAEHPQDGELTSLYSWLGLRHCLAFPGEHPRLIAHFACARGPFDLS
ncbi:MAG: VOC family protein [Propionibacteriaceae bacterium]|jgi:hypothetical protein|nr:VOC family protein [Propionibacteriaceae bacterium]